MGDLALGLATNIRHSNTKRTRRKKARAHT